jgi:2-polyprenyl-6-hydroxyphenyl methylase/3-demethylubiquinone-9 3-methyltransferase
LTGPFEHQTAEAYRRVFVDLDELARVMSAWVPQARRILEVGCGEGAMTERIARMYPTASVIAIDISPSVGRLFRGNTSAVTFLQETVEAIASREPASFDLVVLADVIHHVPAYARRSLMCAINQAMAPDGSLIFKDWIVSNSPIHWLCALSDRYLTGDNVFYCRIGEINRMLIDVFGPTAIRRAGTVGPWHNNVAVLVQRSGPSIVEDSGCTSASVLMPTGD